MMNRYEYLRGWMTGAALAVLSVSPSLADTQNIANVPLFLGETIEPPVLVMLDSSGSMKSPLYTGGFDPGTTYSGMFDSAGSYEYDASIAVNAAAYAVDVDSSRTGAFVAAGCTPSPGNGDCWSGNFLNWLATRRIDASRAVMVGGKLESRSAFDYDSDGSIASGPRFKIVGNNEPSDDSRLINKSDGNSAAYSPIANGTDIALRSPAAQNNGDQLATYNPYAQLGFTGGGGGGGTLIHDENGTAIGEFGRAEIPQTSVDGASFPTDESWVRIELAHDYSDPVVVAKSLTFNGGQPAFVRIRDVDAVDDSFELTIQEWKYLDGAHTDESVAWMVMEKGTYELPGPSAVDVQAGQTKTSKLYVSGGPEDSEEVPFDGGVFNPNDPPVVISSVSTVASRDPVNSRVWDVEHNQFRLALIEEEAQADNVADSRFSDETVDWIAIEPGQVDPGDFADPEQALRIDVGAPAEDVTDGEQDIDFTAPFSTAPIALTDMQTLNGADPAVLRETAINASRVRVFVEEEESGDNETGHIDETVGFVAMAGASQTHNLALAVHDRPAGLLQDIADDVRLGVSFYRYDPDSGDIYNNEKAHGGTLQFQIPKNPFVKKPSASPQTGKSHAQGYRDLEGYVGTDIDQIVDAINHYPLVWGTTPLAENLWEAIQYFEQDDPYYNDKPSNGSRSTFLKADDSNPERDPFYYPDHSQDLACARPSALLFTDGLPFADAYIPAAVVDFDDDGHSEDERRTNSGGRGHDNLDDVAFWGFCDPSNPETCDPGDSNRGTRDLRSDLDGKQYLTVNTIGFGGGGTVSNILQDTADNAGGDAFAAADGAALADAFDKAFEGILSRASFSAVAANTGRIADGARIFQAVFDSTNWSGDLEALEFDTSSLSVKASPLWSAADELPNPGLRDILTFDDTAGAGHDFEWSELSAAQKSALGNDQDVLDFLRGDRSNEGSAAGDFRERGSPLGDIVNSRPVFVPGAGSTVPDMVYVGANDGMLHGFNADTGVEEMAYVPAAVYPGLAGLTNQDYSHEYLVDGSPVFARRYFNETGNRVIVGGLNAGGQAIYALDVDDPTNMDPSNDVLWEFNDEPDSDGDGDIDGDPDLGLTYGDPTVVPLENGNWVAIFGNGYNNTASDGSASSTGHAALFIVDLDTGELIRKIDTNTGGSNDPNGLGTPAVADLDQDGTADVAYAGDLDGNLWKFDLTGNNTNSFSVEKVFTAEGPNGGTQPITTRPEVGLHPAGLGGPVVYFGTGKYLTNSDNSQFNQDTQTFYAIWDQGTEFSRSDLVQQEITEEETISKQDPNDPNATIDNRLRTTTNHEVDWFQTGKGKGKDKGGGDGGWFLDLVDPDTDANEGERIVNNPRLRGDRVVFTTLIPSDSPCDFGGTSWLMEMSTKSGGRLDEPPFDLDDDFNFDADDRTESGETPSGIQRLDDTQGIISEPTFLDTDDAEVKVMATTSGNTQRVVNNPTAGDRGRQSWEVLR